MANGIIRQKQTKQYLAEYLSAACFSPPKSTLLCAIKNNHFTSWPGMTSELISKHLPKSISTEKGHLDQERRNLQSTKNTTSMNEEDMNPKQEINNIRTNDIMCSIFDTEELNSKSYSDQTGKFPITSSRGNKYIFVLYHYDTNTIHAVPIKEGTQNTSHKLGKIPLKN